MGEPKSLIRKIIDSPTVQAMAIYVSSGWILIEILEYFIANFGLIEKSRNILLFILLIGLPITLLLSWHMHRERKKDRETEAGEGESGKKIRRISIRPAIGIPLMVLLILLMVFGAGFLNHRSKSKKVREEIFPELISLNEAGNKMEVFLLLKKHGKLLAENEFFQKYQSSNITSLNIITDPPGAEIYMKEYSDTLDNWMFLGVSPIDSLKIPTHSYFRLRISKEGYEEVMAIASFAPKTFYRKLLPKGDIPEGMVYIDGLGDDFDGNLSESKQGFFLDRYEVTNRQFKEFVDQGGYRNKSYWKHPFVKETDTLSWEEAMAEFIDKSGRPGPSGWEASDFPRGQGAYPVSGISWYEAVAYAEYAGKSVPSVEHWYAGAGLDYFMIQYYLSSTVIKLSNFDGSGPEETGKNQGMNGFGTYDMAGNLREWCFNKSETGHALRGGAWNDGGYTYTQLGQAPSFDRSAKNGFRCAIYPDPTLLPKEIFDPVASIPRRNFDLEEPVEESIFQAYKQNFLYDPAELNAQIEERLEGDDSYNTEKVTFDAAYNGERVIAYLYLPKNAAPPYRTIVFFPGSFAQRRKEFTPSGFNNFGFLLKNGYAVLYPVYKGTFDRSIDLSNMKPNSHAYTDWTVQIVQDFKRSLDYLESRPDIDTAKIGYLGYSWGSSIAGILLAVDSRPKLGILTIGGLNYWEPFPEADHFNYIPRITIPILMMNGKYDPIFWLEDQVKPFFNYLGTPVQDKRLFISDTDHWVPYPDKIRETLNWLDRYFGPMQ